MTNCDCGVSSVVYTVNKEGSNKGRQFRTCKSKNCKYFKWEDSLKYNVSNFKSGSCMRCGRFKCNPQSCMEIYDWFGNKIPTSPNVSTEDGYYPSDDEVPDYV